MKRNLALMIAAALLAVLITACGTGASGGAAPEGTPEELIEAIYAEKPVELNLMTLPIDLADADAVRYNLGLDDASAVKEAAVSEPMMGSQAYSLVVVRVNDAADTEATAKAMLAGIDQRKWICVEADSLRVMTKGDVVLLFMVDTQFADTVTADEIEAAFTKLCGAEPDLVLNK